MVSENLMLQTNATPGRPRPAIAIAIVGTSRKRSKYLHTYILLKKYHLPDRLTSVISDHWPPPLAPQQPPVTVLEDKLRLSRSRSRLPPRTTRTVMNHDTEARADHRRRPSDAVCTSSSALRFGFDFCKTVNTGECEWLTQTHEGRR